MKRTLILIVGLLCLTIGLYVTWDLLSIEKHVADSGQVSDSRSVPGTTREQKGPNKTEGHRQEIELQGKTYTISIVDPDEKPAEGLELTLGQGPSLRRVKTDERGRCTFVPPIQGAKEVQVQIASPDWMLVDLLDQKIQDSIQLPEDPLKIIRLRIHRLLHLSGRVVDAKGGAVPDAGFQLMCQLGRHVAPMSRDLTYASSYLGILGSIVRSDEQGRFSLAIAENTRVSGVQASLGKTQRSEVHDLLAWRNDPGTEIELRLIPLGKIHGKIQSVGMEPPASVRLILRRKLKPEGQYSDLHPRQAALGIYPKTTNRFEFKEILPGEYQIESQIWADGTSGVILEKTELRLLPGEIKEWNLVLRPTLVSTWDIHGVVLNEMGRAVEGMPVRATLTGDSVAKERPAQPRRPFGTRTMSDSQGRFVISAQEGNHILLKTGRLAKHTGPFTRYEVLEKEVVAGQKDVRLQVRSLEAGLIQGRVFFPDGKVPAPFPGISVVFEDPEGRNRSYAVDWNNCTFVMKHLPLGQHKLSVDCSGYQPLSQSVMIQAGRSTPVLLQLKPLESMRGSVVDTQGRPIAGAKLWVNIGAVALRARGFKNPGATTNASGSFKISGLRKRGAFLVAYKSGFAPETRLVKTEGDAQSIRIVLSKEGSLYVRHLPVSGEAFGLKFEKARLYHLNLKIVDPLTKKVRDVIWRPYVPTQPNLIFKHIPAGDYHLLLQVLPPKWKPGKPPPGLWRRVTVKPGDTTTVDWRKLSK